jgi:hypothetical protein
LLIKLLILVFSVVFVTYTQEKYSKIEKKYKDCLIDINSWNQETQAKERHLFSKNVWTCLSLDETTFLMEI